MLNNHSEDNKQFTALGLMSGSSLDGLDIAWVHFTLQNNQWTFEIKAAETFEYSSLWVDRLKNLSQQSAKIYAQTHVYFSHYCAEFINEFIRKHNIVEPLYCIASHGHTIFHEPQNNFTSQIGCGATLAALTNNTVISNYRNADVALGGQGAPLVPLGDKLLFSKYDYCINLGGIANISYNISDNYVAYDCCSCNQILNTLANKLNLPYDDNGAIASSGTVFQEALEKLNQLEYYTQLPPKSLDNNFSIQFILKILSEYNLSIADALCTAVEHIAIQITKSFNKPNASTALVTGGGALNTYLISRIKNYSSIDIVVPDTTIVQYKEALIFALLGVLRKLEMPNVLHTATGAQYEHIAGEINLGTPK